mmetsp:Transcript_3452/g.6623  ORF Transcript_3452/g.6623 Transcript_3452/m.6623 type:complete len:184 (+) Transcript_3452:994-1545(+)
MGVPSRTTNVLNARLVILRKILSVMNVVLVSTQTKRGKLHVESVMLGIMVLEIVQVQLVPRNAQQDLSVHKALLRPILAQLVCQVRKDLVIAQSVVKGHPQLGRGRNVKYVQLVPTLMPSCWTASRVKAGTGEMPEQLQVHVRGSVSKDITVRQVQLVAKRTHVAAEVRINTFAPLVQALHQQ